MELIAGGNDHSAQDCERGPGEELGAWKHQTPRAQPGQSDQAVSDEVAGFANGKYKPVPLNVANRSESSIPDREQQCAGAISAKMRVRHKGDSGSAQQDRPPGFNPKAGVPLTRHGSWELRG